MDMEFQKPSLENKERNKTPERYVFEAESTVSKSRIGNLEEIRFKLGLSRRKMCQLLLVDPSAWTRWNKPGADAPPHIYRALEWYLMLTEKFPGMGNQFWLSTLRTEPSENAKISELEKALSRLGERLVIAEAKAEEKSQMATQFIEFIQKEESPKSKFPLTLIPFLTLGIGLIIGLLLN
jgi:hypothetical protein